jgi:hypothetical protein
VVAQHQGENNTGFHDVGQPQGIAPTKFITLKFNRDFL